MMFRLSVKMLYVVFKFISAVIGCSCFFVMFENSFRLLEFAYVVSCPSN